MLETGAFRLAPASGRNGLLVFKPRCPRFVLSCKFRLGLVSGADQGSGLGKSRVVRTRPEGVVRLTLRLSAALRRKLARSGTLAVYAFMTVVLTPNDPAARPPDYRPFRVTWRWPVTLRR